MNRILNFEKVMLKKVKYYLLFFYSLGFSACTMSPDYNAYNKAIDTSKCYNIISESNHLAISADLENKNDSLIYFKKLNGDVRQKFKLYLNEDGSYFIKSQKDGKFLEVSIRDSYNIIIKNIPTGIICQRFNFVPLTENKFNIISMQNDFLVDVLNQKNDSILLGSNRKNSKASQIFILKITK